MQDKDNPLLKTIDIIIGGKKQTAKPTTPTNLVPLNKTGTKKGTGKNTKSTSSNKTSKNPVDIKNNTFIQAALNPTNNTDKKTTGSGPGPVINRTTKNEDVANFQAFLMSKGKNFLDLINGPRTEAPIIQSKETDKSYPGNRFIASSKEKKSDMKEIKEAQDWFRSYINSPMFRERVQVLQNGGKPLSPLMQSASITNLETDKIINEINKSHSRGYTTYYPRSLGGSTFMGSNYEWIGEDIGNGEVQIEGNQKTVEDGTKHNLGEIKTHEDTHKSNRANLLPDWLYDEMKKQNVDYVNKTNKSGFVQFGREPEELKSDIYGLRFTAKKAGIYDAGTQVFTQEHLDKLKKTFGTKDRVLGRLLKDFSEKDLIKYMNLISQQKNSDTNKNNA